MHGECGAINTPRMIAPPPIQQSFPIVMARAYSGPLRPSRLSGSRGCPGGYSCTMGPNRTCTCKEHVGTCSMLLRLEQGLVTQGPHDHLVPVIK